MAERDVILSIIKENENITVDDIIAVLKDHDISIDTHECNSILYSLLHEELNIYRPAKGPPLWKIRKIGEARKGLETMIHDALLKIGIKSDLNYSFNNHPLDLAIITKDKKLNVEADDFSSHVRMDAIKSMAVQLSRDPTISQCDVDWLDHTNSYVDPQELNDQKYVYKWCNKNIPWCIEHRKDLLRPKNIKRDIQLNENGWDVMRFWNKEIIEGLDNCVSEIKNWYRDKNITQYPVLKMREY